MGEIIAWGENRRVKAEESAQNHLTIYLWLYPCETSVRQWHIVNKSFKLNLVLLRCVEYIKLMLSMFEFYLCLYTSSSVERVCRHQQHHRTSDQIASASTLCTTNEWMINKGKCAQIRHLTKCVKSIIHRNPFKRLENSEPTLCWGANDFQFIDEVTKNPPLKQFKNSVCVSVCIFCSSFSIYRLLSTFREISIDSND